MEAIFYGVKRDPYDKFIGIRSLSERLALDCFNNHFLTDTGGPENNIPLLDEVDDLETFSTYNALRFLSSASSYKDISSIFDLALNSALLPASDMVASTIKYQNAALKEKSGEGGGYNRTDICYCQGRLPNGNICLKITLFFQQMY